MKKIKAALAIIGIILYFLVVVAIALLCMKWSGRL